MTIMKPRSLYVFLLFATLVVFLWSAGCTQNSQSERKVIESTGVLKMPDSFGSSLRIIGDDGLVYLPSPFPYVHFRDGDSVAFTAITQPDPLYPISSGIPVEIVFMQQLPEGNGYIYGFGNVTYVPLEGGFYGINVDTGGAEGTLKYYPLDMDEEFQKDGLHVSFTAKGSPGTMTTVQWGIPVNIVRMKALS